MIILFQTRENVSRDFWNIETSVWEWHHEYNTTSEWYKCFKEGQTVEDNECSGWPSKWQKMKKIWSSECDIFHSSFGCSWCSRESHNFKNYMSWDSHRKFGHASSYSQICAKPDELRSETKLCWCQ